jgi:hypothetical protein
VTLAFLGTEEEAVTALFARIKPLIQKEVFAGRLEDYDRTIEAFRKVAGAYDVKNVASQMMIVLDLFERHMTDLQEGWVSDEPDGPKAKHKEPVPIASVLGRDMLPPAAAIVLRQAVKKAQHEAKLEDKDLWRALEVIAKAYLERGQPAAAS